MIASGNIFTERLGRLQKSLSAWTIEALLITNMDNVRYLSGFAGSEGLLVVCPDHSILLVDGRYTIQARLQCEAVEVMEFSDRIAKLVEVFRKRRPDRIGFESASMNVGFYRELTRRLRGTSLVALDNDLRCLRARKDAGEIALMKKAAGIGSSAIRTVLKRAESGWTEREFALALEFAARQAGADALAFDPIVASGKNAALPHAKPSGRKLRRGDFVVVDFGVRYRGYCSDETCTFAIGELTDAQKNAYRAVKLAHDEAIALIRHGVKTADVDACVRRVFGKKYEKYFVHGTGHGVGLDVHEPPRLASGSADVLETGMVVTVEPGLYFPGRWGIRIEDTVWVQEKGCEKITSMNKKLIVMD